MHWVMKSLKLQLPLWASRLMRFFFSNICVWVCQQQSPRHLLELLRWKHNHWPNGSLDLVADCLCRKFARAWIFTSCLWPGGFKESIWKETLPWKTVSYQISKFIAKEHILCFTHQRFWRCIKKLKSIESLFWFSSPFHGWQWHGGFLKWFLCFCCWRLYTTQPLLLQSLLEACSNVQIDLWMTDLPTTEAVHFFQPLKSDLIKHLSNLFQVHDLPP